MKIAVHLARNRRLLAWCALSVVLHLLLMLWVDARFTPPPLPEVGTPLALRLVPTPQPATAPQADAPAAAAQASAAAPMPLPAPAPAPAPALRSVPLDAAGDAPAPAASPAQAQDRATGILPQQMPGRYQCARPRPPASATP
ncbi:hypothetical protein G4G28_14505 [Massilia sp. Dwa41.01b]|uniref:hypothetical protein n=1 Tax=Massilia sp. Dwa41.01b TaxID=2709302 RepID=UPI00160434B2|nr:hypothetical protein [Massilia sp. Dwa41.01b]QNA89382.1 hypothetical protein G4G28_14505 [Massilia sp. Dwa41.01b]